jgi:aminoglycoside phosphotransferase (APT) family kinase protein
LKHTIEKLQPTDLVGRGFTSDVYAWGPGRVLKLFHDWVLPDRIEREYRTTRAIRAAGLPAPAVYELVTVEGRKGIVFERLEGVSMLVHFQRTPWKMFAAVRQVADLQAKILATCAPSELPTQRDRLRSGIQNSPVLSVTEKQQALDALAKLPDGTSICHGDFHPENILFTTRGPIAIDWGSASRGAALGDVACTARLIQTANLPSWTPWHMHQLLTAFRILLHRAYTRRSLQHHSGTLQEIAKWKVPYKAAATSWRIPKPASEAL